MNSLSQARLLKVLALADSSQDGEAVAAVRMAKQLLAQDGMSLSDLVQGRARPATLRPLPDHIPTTRVLETQISELQKRLIEAQRTVQERNTALAAVTNRLQQMEQAAGRNQAEVEKWRTLARDTANKLWDIGQQIAEDRGALPDTPAITPRRDRI